MSTNAKLGQGSTIKWDGTLIADVKKIGSIPLENSEVEVTDLDSAAKEFIAGLKDYGVVTIEGNYIPTDGGQVKLEADAVTGTIREVIIAITNLSKTITFNAFCKSLKFGESTPEGVIPFTADLRITGAIATTTANLTGLTISDGTLTPAFSASKYTYGVIVTSETVTVTPTLAGSVITVTANGVSQTVSTGEASSAITVEVGAVTEITISAAKTGGISVYTIYAAKAAA